MNRSIPYLVLSSWYLLISCATNTEKNADTYSPLNGAEPPQSYDELWSNYDPRAEPLDVEILKEWEEEGILMKVIRYRVGVFKGEKAMVAGIYGYPKGKSNLPGLVQIHGGGQYADYRAVLENGKRGYATISISWGGRINAPGYKVSPAEVKLFWADSTDHPDYKLTTDWAALDGYHAPHREEGTSTTGISPTKWTIDDVDSPRNNIWFIWTLAARRAITFIERQQEVDSTRIGVYGHSMGGTLTTLTATDSRVKAAAPSCGGVSLSDRGTEALADYNYLKRITCPIMFLSPSNDFHGKFYDLKGALTLIKTDQWRVTCSAHHSHQDTPEFEAANILWFDQILKNKFEYPSTPETKVSLERGLASIEVMPDTVKKIVSVDVYYWQPKVDPDEISRDLRKTRFWHHTKPHKSGEKWVAELALESVERNIWVYANVLYRLDEEVSGAGYYYRTYTTDKINLSSKMKIIKAEDLQKARVKATLKPSSLIETFEGDWEIDWFTYNRKEWEYKTHKINNDLWKAPSGNYNLSIEIFSDHANKMVIRADSYATEIDLKGGGWEVVELTADQFKNAMGDSLADFMSIMELELSPEERQKRPEGDPVYLGGDWKGGKPKFRNLRWIMH
ncbi:MAG: dienelactone hydrolase family protein [Cyclobacteriaceae bacterium]